MFPVADRVVVRAAVGGGPVLDGANLTVSADFGAPPTKKVGGEPSPGGVQEVLINAHAPTGTHKFSSFQALCKEKGAPGPTTTELPCSDLPAAQIRPPQVGDTEVQVTICSRDRKFSCSCRPAARRRKLEQAAARLSF